MGEEIPSLGAGRSITPWPEHDMLTGGIGICKQVIGRLCGTRIRMNSNAPEIMPETLFKQCPGGLVQRHSRCAQDATHEFAVTPRTWRLG